MKAQDALHASANPTQLVPGIGDRYRKLSDLADTLLRSDVHRARAELRELVGEIEVRVSPSEIRLETKKGALEDALYRLAGGQQLSVVAGAGYRLRRH